MAILAVPGEFTTMSGRRLRESLANTAAGLGEDMEVVIAGLSNTYTHYIATYEEYQKQRYEAASTIYGPHTLSAYIQQFNHLLQNMIEGNQLQRGPPPPNLFDDQLSFVPGVVMDNAPPGLTFGDCIQQPDEAVEAGTRVSARFISGHLRNNLMLESSFLTVEKQEADGGWEVVARDADWETRLVWTRTNVILGESEVTVTWDIPPDWSGVFRIGHMGYWHTIIRSVSFKELLCRN